MKVRTWVLLASVSFLLIAAGTKNVSSFEGSSPGDRAPRIEFLENNKAFDFQNQSGRYTLLSFWAAYDAESRARNVRIESELSRMCLENVSMYSISLDENASIFTETVRIDCLDYSTNIQEKRGKSSDVYRDYDLRKGLRNFLIDDKGMIVAVNVEAQFLEMLANRK